MNHDHKTFFSGKVKACKSLMKVCVCVCVCVCVRARAESKVYGHDSPGWLDSRLKIIDINMNGRSFLAVNHAYYYAL